MNPNNVSSGSDKKAWFICPKNPKHKYERVIKTVVNKSGKYVGCPYCRGLKAFPGETDFFTKCPEAKEYWDYDRNPQDLDPTQLLPNSTTVAHFKCNNGHTFQKRITDFASNPKCIKCDLISLQDCCPEATRDWDYERNEELTPDNVSLGSNKKAWFICPVNPEHKYQRKIGKVLDRKGKYIGCPYCNGSKVFPGKTDFFTKCPEVRDYWDYDRNPQDLDPTQLFPHSSIIAQFKCSKGHLFSKRIVDFTLTPKCTMCKDTQTSKSNFKPLREYSFEATRDWDYSKNGDLTPDNVSYGSQKKAWFICPDNPNHKYERTINAVTNKKGEYLGCPYCNGSKAFPGETDFFTVCPEAKVFWDFNSNPQELNPTELLPHSSISAHFKCSKNHKFIKKIVNFTAAPNCPECKFISLKEYSSEAARDWDYSKNGDLTPSDVSYKANIIAHFKCNSNPKHEYERHLSVVVNKNGEYVGCPYCNGSKAFPGETDFFTVCPEAKNFWDYDKNPSDKNPMELLPTSHISVHFRCFQGHSFEKEIRYFSENPTCPECSKITLREYSPEAALDWDYDRNGNLTPDNLTYGLNLNAHFICVNNSKHKYVRSIGNITNTKGEYVGCPYCNGTRAFPGESDLFTIVPLAKQFWDFDENPTDLDPIKLLPDSNITAHFKCSKGHKFKRIIKDFTSNPTCPYCNDSRAIPGETDFFTICPEAKDFWDFERNPSVLNPNKLLPYSTVIAHFKCNNGHHFTKKISDFTYAPQCTICNYDFIDPSINSLQAEYPILIDNEWNYLANSLLGMPDNISPKSSKSFFWTCQKCGNVYPASVSSRIKVYIRGQVLCPVCKGLRNKYNIY